MKVWRMAIGAAAAVAIAACTSSSESRASLPLDPAKGEDAADADPWAGRDLIEPPAPPEPAPVPLPKVATRKLENGLEVIVVEDRDIPVAEVHVAVRAGEREVEREKTGLARFAAEMLTRGTEERDALAIAEAIDFVGGSLRARAGHEATWLSCEVLSSDVDACLELLPEMLVRPTFPADEMEQVERMLRSEVRARRDDAGQLAARHLQNALWGDDHVRGWVLSEASLDAIEREDLVAWHGRWFSPDNAMIAVAGDVDADAIAGAIERALGGWEARALPERPAHEEPEIEGLSVRLVDKPGQTQAHIHVGHLGISRHDDDFFDLMVVNYALGGGGFSSRLMRVLRSEAGMTYGASSSFDQNADRGALVASTFTHTPQAAETARLLLGELEAMAAEGPTADEVQSAVGNLASRYAMRFETAGDVAGALLSARVRGLGPDDVRDYPLHIGAVTAQAAQRVAARRLDPRNLVAVIVGPADDIAPQLEREGWRYEVVDHHAPVAAYERRAREAAARAPVDPEAARAGAEILERALEAKGGHERLSALDTVIMEGRAQIQMGPQSLPAKLVRTFAAPNRVRVDIDVRGGLAEITTAYDGERGWMRQVAGGQTQVVDLPESDRAAVEAELWRDPELILLRHRDDGTVAAALEPETIEGERHHVVRLRSEVGHEATLAIHAGSHRLSRMTYTGPTGGETVETFADYQDVDGVSVAHERESAGPEQSLELTIDHIRFGEAVEPSRFAKP